MAHMDIHTRMLRWENSVADNPAVLFLEILIVLTFVFLCFVFMTGYAKKKDKKRDREQRARRAAKK
jgi:hypothetical protein